MALETLNGIEHINGTKVHRLVWDHPEGHHIEINDDYKAITFKIQDGPVKENGVNGCQVDTIIEAAKLIVEGLNKNFPCRENAMVITKLDEALLWSMKRKLDREKRGVEGKNLA